MKVISTYYKLNTPVSFKETQQKDKPEIIDTLLQKIKNPKDVQDCVAVPRGIFKAYMCIMGGSALLAISGLLPKCLKHTKKIIAGAGIILNFFSAIFFAKPFFVKSLSPTVKMEDYNKSSSKN